MAKTLGFPERCLARPAARCLKNKNPPSASLAVGSIRLDFANSRSVLTPEQRRHDMRWGGIPTSMVNLQSGHGYVKSGRLRWNHSQVLKFPRNFAPNPGRGAVN
jgi:hypothetical protein